jgi:hypothetical protein
VAGAPPRKHVSTVAQLSKLGILAELQLPSDDELLKKPLLRADVTVPVSRYNNY